MVGVLECLDESGDKVYLRAFAGKFGGAWERKGWSPVVGSPPPDVEAFVESARDVEEMMGEIGEIEERLLALSEGEGLSERLDEESSERREKESSALRGELAALRAQQRSRATEGLRALQRQMIARNFRGEERALADVFVRKQAEPKTDRWLVGMEQRKTGELN